jgi:hypothetical protein
LHIYIQMTELDNLKKRFALFLFGCIGTRALLAYIAKIVSIDNLPYLGYIAILPVIGFIYIYITGARKTGAEVFGEKIWWNDLRPLHALLYGLFAYHAILKHEYAWMFLVADVSIGLISFMIYHSMNGDFAKLL